MTGCPSLTSLVGCCCIVGNWVAVVEVAGVEVVKPKEKDGLVSAGFASVVAVVVDVEGKAKEKDGFGGSLVVGAAVVDPKREVV